MLTFFNFFMGTILGSHALVVVERNYNKSFVNSFSRCDTCHYPLTLLDQIPLFSYLLKRGKCSHCKEPISPFIFFIELFSGLCFSKIFLFSQIGFSSGTFLFFFLVCALFDYYFLEFETILLLVPFTISLTASESSLHFYSAANWLLLLILVLLMFYMNLKGKFGTGDTLFFILISLYKGQIFGLHSLLLSSILFLIIYLFNRQKDPLPFLPFMLTGYALLY